MTGYQMTSRVCPLTAAKLNVFLRNYFKIALFCIYISFNKRVKKKLMYNKDLKDFKKRSNRK